MVRCPLRLPAQPPARGGMREGWCSRACPPIFSTRLPLHSLSLAGLPKYDLSSGLAREADKSPLRTKFGRKLYRSGHSHAAPRLTQFEPSPRRGKVVCLQAAQKRDGEFASAAPHASVLLGEGEGPSHALMSMLTLALLHCAAVAAARVVSVGYSRR